MTALLREARRERVKAGGIERRVYAHARHFTRPARLYVVRDVATGGIDYLAWGASRRAAGFTRRECADLFGPGATEMVSFIRRPEWFEALA